MSAGTAERHRIDVGGSDVVAVHHPSDGDGWLFFSHGFLSDMTGSYVGRCERAAEEGYDAVRFDHRGCGNSDLSFDQQNLTTRIDDLCAVVDYFGSPSCVLFGSSFGGKVVLHAAARRLSAETEAVAARAPVTYNEPLERYRGGVAGTGNGFFDDLAAYGFDGVADSLDAPVALFHGREDEAVDPDDSFRAASELRTDAVVEAYEGEGHGFSEEAEERMRDRLFGWLSEVRRR
jgi:pimeloyl-ACP methyl ester carboxylesterase